MPNRTPWLLAGCALLAALSLGLFLHLAGSEEHAREVSSARERTSALEEGVGPAPPAAGTGLRAATDDGEAAAGARREVEAAAEREKDGFAAAEAERAGASFELVGRFVDEAGQGLAGIEVHVRAPSPWSEVAEVPASHGRANWSGWSTESDAEGRFSFTGPAPRPVEVQLWATPDTHRANIVYQLGGDRNWALPELTAGTRDLGDISLVAAGAIAGTVIDPAGNPVEDAALRPLTLTLTNMWLSARSDAEGRFLFGHVPPGDFALHISHGRFRTMKLENLVVRAGETLELGAIALEHASLLTGRIVDTNSRPIEGASVTGRPERSGSWARGVSDEEGYFELFLPQDSSFFLMVECQGFRPYNQRTDPEGTEAHPPGTGGILVILESADRVRLAVVDASSGEAILSFGHRVDPGQGSRAPRGETWYGMTPGPLRTHQDGQVEIEARPGHDRLSVVAKGYGEFEGDVPAPDPATGLARVELRPGSGLTGRVVHAGEPLDQVTLRAIHTSSSTPAWGWPSATSEPGGRFHMEGVPPGPIRLEAKGAEGRVAVHDLLLPPNEVFDIGDLELGPPAFLVVRLLREPGEGLAEISVGLQSTYGDPRKSAITDEFGRARLGDIPAGSYRLQLFLDVEPAPLPIAVTLAPGELREVQFDLTRSALARLELQVRAGSRDLAGWRVELRPQVQVLYGTFQSISLGTLDGSGRLRAEVRALEGARLLLRTPGGVPLTHPTRRLDLPAGAEVNVSVDFALADLELRFPDRLALPERTRLFVQQLSPEYNPEVSIFTGRVSRQVRLTPDTDGDLAGQGFHRPAHGIVRLGPFFAGSGDIQVRLVEDTGDRTHFAIAGPDAHLLYEHTFRAHLETGAPTVITLP